MKFFLKTTGCRANQWDSYVISNLLIDKGHTQSQLDNADVCIINACALTENAERDIKRFINQCRTKNPETRIIIAGCHGQVYPEKSYGADLIMGNREKFDLPDYIQAIGIVRGENNTLFLEEANIKGVQAGKTRFFLKIQDGCDRFCTYCVVPFARGRPRSRPVAEVLEAVRILKEKGIKEVVLTGIELSAYQDGERGIDLKGLLMLLEGSETPDRIRLSSIDPLYIDDEFMDILRDSKKIARSIHISVQSFSDKVLRLMARHYTRDYLLDMIDRLIKKVDGIGIGIDIIAGFPSEDEEDFMDTLRAIDSTGIYYTHIFSYSPRQGTEAARMPLQIPSKIKKDRVARLKDMDRKKRLAFYERFIGKKAVIIPEAKIYKGNLIRGYTDNFIPVYMPYKKTLENRLIEVKIKAIKDGLLMAEEI
ncbi:MAG TPA: tRNA (N(6)-L-threonylcarbamoyladenosine(37)-C(2))-methylthiotransferase MtaB [Syntrophorhabdaceae bacterium]|nr:tRNA (N(6)-L-threonylcarbamoyladenosine(37)-C(2))-methylthiotransferase MtaB [Syntrophorhabdaceae bacterium]HPP41726.1 tRNA (N(6)-L-threonylcarbamoyladenosine(37)-C(2))-methylthiotransferase MtaB [Syntrophorhabdaceae bacterium]HQE79548.1 tRNA (N(6)-L-threonylcarbamoyladenosine(37)-C(2))-methylthiotransferase MtaB [Syntrophorhabdaceae bacterium]